MKQLEITEYIADKIIEWRGKTISDKDHFEMELKKTLVDVARFAVRDVQRAVNKPNTQ